MSEPEPAGTFYASTLLVAALVAAPALAQSSWDEFDAREYDDLFTRHPDEAGLAAREDTAPTSLFARGSDFDFDDTFERRSTGVEDALAARELDELYTRALEQLETRSTMLSFFNFMRDGMKQVKQIAHQPPTPAGTTTAAKGAPSATPSKAATSNTEASPEGQAPPAGQAPLAAPGGEPAAPAEGSEPPADAAAAPADPSADGAPAAREFYDADLWERAFDEDNALYEREYYDDDALYGRAYDDAEEFYAREYYDDEALYGRSYYDDLD
ncbi:hypothetical protein HYPSUDRAFT_203006 [Hypholoma sublateritium FD-334 SS-4]|uniref:Uncharacterized protein n=1 Tax=Hypholoma sublateritium (strain FD-334 SS-4) TaxID=945553 RepID=A0A0D2NRP3_HYPSF|nr:hypothetical protein HYPSUDRAFT_203006 [Hypholoma sublateritium FD-334 SS-4]